MGASDSKLIFKQGIFRLSEPKYIPPSDEYWQGFWDLPESSEDVFTLFSPTDIRRARDNSITNLETLVTNVVKKLIELRNTPSFPDAEVATARQALNCIRVLTRILPFLYEAEHLESWEEKVFWEPRQKTAGPPANDVMFDSTTGIKEQVEEPAHLRPLGEELLDTLIDLLFFSDFTLPPAPQGKANVSYVIWSTGVGCNTPIVTNKELESNKTEILRLLLVIFGKAMYTSSTLLPAKGVHALTYLATCSDKQIILSVLCSLLNTTLKYNPAIWRVPYDHVVFRDDKQLLVIYCLQVLLALVIYPVPETQNGIIPKNQFRHYLGRLHRPQDFQFIVEGMNRTLSQPMQANNSYLPGSQKSLTWTPELVILFWEMLQTNKRFRSFIIDTDRSHDFVILVLFHATENRLDQSKQVLVRTCIFVLQTLSVEPNFGKSLNKRFEGHDSLPKSIQIANFHGTYADYLVCSIYFLLTSSKGRLDAVQPALLAILNNIAPQMENLSRATCNKLLQLFATMSTPSFLLANETNHTSLTSTLEVINAVIENQYSKNPNLILSIYNSKRILQNLREFTLEGGRIEIERQTQVRKEQGDSIRSPIIRSPNLSNVPEENGAFAVGDDTDDEETDKLIETSMSPSISSVVDEMAPFQPRRMSEKARGKMPAGSNTFSRQNSTSSIHSLQTSFSHSVGTFQPTPEWIESWQPDLPLHTSLSLITYLDSHLDGSSKLDDSSLTSLLHRLRSTPPPIDPSPIRVHLFEWSPLSLGWYASLLWGNIFASEAAISRGPSGVWTGTAIKLFRVQEVAAASPSLLAPRGAVDAVGSNLVRGIGRLGLGSRNISTSSVTTTSGAGNVRDV